MILATRFFRSWTNWIGLLIVFLFFATAAAAPLLAPPVPGFADDGTPALTTRKIVKLPKGANRLIPQSPSALAPLGTSDAQQDIFYMVVWGTREVVWFSLRVTLLTAAIGMLVGSLSGYLGGLVGELLMRLTDGFLTIPVVAGYFIFQEVKILLVTQVANGADFLFGIGQPHPELIRILEFDVPLWAIVLLSWMPYARMTHSMILRIKDTEFITAARALGAGPLRMIFRHLLPNAISPSVVLLARDFGALVLLQAGLAFAGFGGSNQWVSLLLSQRRWVIGAGGNPFGYWWVWLPVTMALTLYGVSWNILGDGLTDALNPTDRGRFQQGTSHLARN